ncbi:MAG: HlyC/CorC family transporter [Lachnospiraceae bacterium]|nr:HlyC/CorC family transporter [Lachnospiraceae bacterium]
MDPDSIPRSIIVIVCLLFAGAFFSGTETAYTNLSRVRLLSWAEDGKRGAKRALKVLEQFDKTLITLLIGNNVAHVVITALATVIAIQLAGEISGPILATVIITLLVFIFAETLPKNIAKVRADEWACTVSLPLQLLIWLLTPIDWVFMGMSFVLKKLFKGGEEGPSMTEDEFSSMVETIESEGGLEAEESELIQSAVEFKTRSVREVMTPRVHMVGLDLEDKREEQYQTILEEKYSRLPVYTGDLDHIEGILNTKRYLQLKLEAAGTFPDIRALMAEPYFIEPDMSLHALVEEMRRRQMHMAIIRDEWGGTEGMVTLEDLLEELVGDIWDEDEEQEASA